MTSTSEAQIAFRCTACGVCCNSPPALTLPELFHHERTFFGCLALRRVPRITVGARLPHRAESRFADSADVLESAALAEHLLYALPKSHDYLSLQVQAFTYPSQAGCSERGLEGACALHDRQKPLTCRVVPFDAVVPDRLQGAVLTSRAAEAAYLGSDCIRFPTNTETMSTEPQDARRADEADVAVDGARVVDDDALAALAEHRRALAEEKRHFGAHVVSLLVREASFDLRALPEAGFFALSLAPALTHLAVVSERCRARCVAFLDAQAPHGEALLGRALARRSLLDRPATAQLRAFLETNKRLRDALVRMPPAAASSERNAAAVERWLGISE